MAQSPWILVVDRHLTLCVLGRVHTQGGRNRRVRTCQSQSAAEVPIFWFAPQSLVRHVIASSVKHGPPFGRGLAA
jgi:hypothetical protein